MDERQVVKEIIAYLGAGKRHLERELEKKRREYEKMEASFSELPSTPFWEKIFRRKLKSLMWEKEDRLREEILELKQKMEQCTLELKKQLNFFPRSQSIKEPQNRV